jgi:hypothetical protein
MDITSDHQQSIDKRKKKDPALHSHPMGTALKLSITGGKDGRNNRGGEIDSRL